MRRVWWWMMRWGRDRLRARWGVRPHQKHRTGSVVDDKPAVRAEAARPEVRAVAVPGQDEQLGAFSGRDHLAFDSPDSLLTLAGASEPGRRLVE